MFGSVSLQHYIERILEEKQKALELAFQAGKDALELASTALERELGHLNQLRQEVLSDRSLYITREKYDTDSTNQEARITALEKFQNKLVGVGLIAVAIAAVIGAAIGKVFGF